jgi:murein DD-endopeptidase MepM/ murein hydrolase activator NlpD
VAGLILLGLLTGCAGAHRAPSGPFSVPATPADGLVIEEPESSAAPQPTPAAPAAHGVHHTVSPGQTLWRIATTYGLEVEEVARANGIADPTRIEVGQVLLIPGATERIEVLAYTATTVPPTRENGSWAWPVSDGRILSYFGAPRRNHSHAGVDILGQHGERVVAAADGLVVYSGSTMRGYGKTIILDHGGGLSSLYAHNSGLLVHRGQWVRRGQPIAKVGRTGNASADHCHFEIRKNDVPVDPLRYVIPAVEARR